MVSADEHLTLSRIQKSERGRQAPVEIFTVHDPTRLFLQAFLHLLVCELCGLFLTPCLTHEKRDVYRCGRVDEAEVLMFITGEIPGLESLALRISENLPV